MDSADEDHDGNRAEPVYAGYIYAEQNVGISGYTPDEVADWTFGTLQQAAHSPPPPADVNLLVNGDFSAGTDGWTPSGQLQLAVDQDGVLRFTAPAHRRAAGLGIVLSERRLWYARTYPV